MTVYEIVTARILEALARKVVPWRKPWSSELPRNLVTGREYRGVNVFLLQTTEFKSPHWLTFKQSNMLGGTVRRGERGCPVVFWRPIEEQAADGTSTKRFVLRYFTVFNVEHAEGIEIPPTAPQLPQDPIETCERIVAGYAAPPRIEHGGAAAFYVPAEDRIQIPGRRLFASLPEYYSTLFHELVHSTGAPHRLARKGVVYPTRFGSHEYSFEELTAECGAAFLCAESGISPSTLDNSTAYLASWSRRLQSNPRWLLGAAAQASRAADLVLGRTASHQAEIVEGAAA